MGDWQPSIVVAFTHGGRAIVALATDDWTSLDCVSIKSSLADGRERVTLCRPMTKPERILTLPFALAFLANFLTAMSLHAYLHLPGFLQQLGARELRIGIIMGIMSISGILARPAIGRWLDMRGRHVVARWGGLLMIVACLLYLTVSSLGPWIYAVRVLHGLALAAVFSSLFTIAADVVPESRRTGGLALFGVSGLLPLALGGWLGEIAISIGSYPLLYWSTAGAAALGWIATLFLRDSRPGLDLSDTAPGGFFVALAAPPLRPVWIVGFGFAICIAASFTFLKTFVIETRLGSVTPFFAAYALSAVAIRIATAWVIDRMPQKGPLYPAIGATALGLFALAAATSPSWLIAAGVLCGLGHGYVFPTLTTLVVVRTSPSHRGSAMSVFTALFDAGLLVGGPALGGLIRLTSYSVMFSCTALWMLVVAVAFWRWDRGHGVTARAPGESLDALGSRP